MTDRGVTFVIMPLLSLIEDNINFVKDLGIPAVSLSGNSISEKRMAILYDEIRCLKYKLVYLTPEKVAKSPGLVSIIEQMYLEKKVERFAIDEVHCVSHWG